MTRRFNAHIPHFLVYLHMHIIIGHIINLVCEKDILRLERLKIPKKKRNVLSVNLLNNERKPIIETQLVALEMDTNSYSIYFS